MPDSMAKDMPDRTRGSNYVSLCQNIFENICWIARINTGKDLLDTDARQNARRYRRKNPDLKTLGPARARARLGLSGDLCLAMKMGISWIGYW